MKLTAIALAIFWNSVSCLGEMSPRREILIGANRIEVFWNVPSSNSWPSMVWVYRIVPQNFSSAVVSNLMALGPFTMAERVLQKIWLHRDFDNSRMSLADGRRLEVISPGEWNLLDGPDFHGARLRLPAFEVIMATMAHGQTGNTSCKAFGEIGRRQNGMEWKWGTPM